MQKDIALYCTLAAFAFIVEGIAAAWLLFGAPAGGIVLQTYILLGIAIAFVGVIVMRLNRDERRQSVESQFENILRKPGAIERARSRIYTWIFSIITVICWPAIAFGEHVFRLRRASHLDSGMRMSARQTLIPMEVSVSLFAMLGPALLTLLAAVSYPPHSYAIKFIWLMIFAVFLKHLTALISRETVQAKLRRAIDPVALNYGIITLADLAGLILCYNAIINWDDGPAFTIANIQAILQKLLAFRDFTAAYRHPPDTVLAYCLGISGLLWWFTLAQGLWQFKAYQRQPVDYLGLAAACVLVGREDKARAFLESSVPSVKEEFASKGLLYAGLGDFDRAETFIKLYLRQTDVAAVEESCIFTQMGSGLLFFYAGQDRYHRLMERGLQRGTNEIVLANTAWVCCIGGGDPGSFAGFVHRLAPDRLVLTWLLLKFLADEASDAMPVFEQAEPAAQNAGRALWLCLEPLYWLSRRKSEDETTAFLDQWCNAALAEIGIIGASIPDDFVRCCLIDCLLRIKEIYARRGIALPNIDAVLLTLMATLPQNEVIDGVKRAWPNLAPAPAPIGQPAAVAAQIATATAAA